MGFFSWTCAKTGLPILAGSVSWPEDLAHLTRVVYLDRNGGRCWATYDGYGHLFDAARIENVDPDVFLGDEREVKLVLQHAYAGERWHDLPPSGTEPNQGFFWQEDDLRDVVAGRMPLPSYLGEALSEKPLDVAALSAAVAGLPALAGFSAAGFRSIGSAASRREAREAVLAAIAEEDARHVPSKEAPCSPRALALRTVRRLLGEVPLDGTGAPSYPIEAPVEIRIGGRRVASRPIREDGDIVLEIFGVEGRLDAQRLFLDARCGTLLPPIRIEGAARFRHGPALVSVGTTGGRIVVEAEGNDNRVFIEAPSVAGR